MKAISIKQPWATLVAVGKKTIECRTWKTNIRGDILICSSKSTEYEEEKGICGLALGVVDLVNCRKMTREDLLHAHLPQEWHYDALKGYAWVLEHKYQIIPFKQKGQLNFFNVDDSLINILPSHYNDFFDYLREGGLIK